MPGLSTEELVDLVLGSAHERLQQRCTRDKIIEVALPHHAARRQRGSTVDVYFHIAASSKRCAEVLEDKDEGGCHMTHSCAHLP